jgi:hypothetical protein
VRDPLADFRVGYPLVNVYITMENHHFLWVNPLFLWSFSIAMLNYQRVNSMSVPETRRVKEHVIFTLNNN